MWGSAERECPKPRRATCWAARRQAVNVIWPRRLVHLAPAPGLERADRPMHATAWRRRVQALDPEHHGRGTTRALALALAAVLATFGQPFGRQFGPAGAEPASGEVGDRREFRI
ncbi:hypothetical protein SAMN07250955_12117 [Arboricoccus pini]|uniref:Uncharacterized protein n=1 Tax=Arboricoccus pini TaxID=1963835 RepID=A0A212S343_9PROT|nr:hypothetical protein SAMN07250955_12117 [Arboricoccus pini]